ncbi:MAG TPA: glutamate ABC transporter substrate-binding protein [Acidimicrobiales bacterium]|nr:glutamate ABC transporter substrate-binding protein [Acidimicrobiales bacterium]
MTRRRWWTIALLLVVALTGAACGDDDDGGAVTNPTDDKGGDEVARPSFASGSTMASLQSDGKITIGVKFDQPGFGQKNPTTGKIEGFDVEIGKLIAQGIYGGRLDGQEANIEFVEAVSKNREPFIQEGRVDLVIATYTINDTRKQVVDFAGPYFVAQQDLMVKAGDNAIKSVTDLAGKKVCTVKGSTSEKNVRAKAPTAEVTLFDTYSQCAEALGDGRVVAVTTDNTILAGLVSQSNNAYKLVKAPFSDEPYGVGLKKGDQAFRDFLNDRLEEIFRNGQWAAAFERTLGKLGLDTPRPPSIDRYATTGGSTGSSTSTTAGGSGGTSSSTSSSSASSSTTSTTR